MNSFLRISKPGRFAVAALGVTALLLGALQPGHSHAISSNTTANYAAGSGANTSASTAAKAFATIPEVQEFHPAPTVTAGDGFQLTSRSRIVVKAPRPQRARIVRDATRFAQELAATQSTHRGRPLRVVASQLAQPRNGDIVLRLNPVTSCQESRYTLQIGSQAEATACAGRGLFYSTRSMLQVLRANGALPAGRVVDWASKPNRIMHVDAGRKYFPLAWFKTQIRRMSYLKMNQLQYHFSENEGYRLESTTYPSITSSEYLTKDEVREMIRYAEEHYIEVIPAFDMPGHMAAILNHFPQFRASQTEEGRKILDYSNPAARQMVKNLIDEYAELFPSTTWHMGGDEVFDLDSDIDQMGTHFPQLVAYARQHAQAGEKANILDGYTYFLGELNRYLRSKGKTDVRAWNDALYWEGVTETLDPRVTITYWSRWFKTWVSTETIRSHGHKIINFNGDALYYVVTKPGKAYYIKPSPAKIYRWNLGIFPNRFGITCLHPASEQNKYPLPTPEWLTGAAFSIWADFPDEATPQQVSDDIYPRLAALAAKVWKESPSARFGEFSRTRKQAGEPVDVAVGRL